MNVAEHTMTAIILKEMGSEYLARWRYNQIAEISAKVIEQVLTECLGMKNFEVRIPTIEDLISEAEFHGDPTDGLAKRMPIEIIQTHKLPDEGGKL